MKVILTGSSGFIGHEVLKQCLEAPFITSIVALSRRDLPSSVTSNPKLRVTIMNDFLSYSDPILEDIKGANACIWSLGKARMPDNEMARRVSIDYTLAAVRAFSQHLVPEREGGGKFRFIYCSGAAAERDQTKPLWLFQDYRRIRGQVENELVTFSKEHQNTLEAYIMRPAMVLSRETNMRSLLFGLGSSVRVDTLAVAMLKVALNGNDDQILENSTISQIGGSSVVSI